MFVKSIFGWCVLSSSDQGTHTPSFPSFSLILSKLISDAPRVHTTSQANLSLSLSLSYTATWLPTGPKTRRDILQIHHDPGLIVSQKFGKKKRLSKYKSLHTSKLGNGPPYTHPSLSLSLSLWW